jgi:hypothetical protein
MNEKFSIDNQFQSGDKKNTKNIEQIKTLAKIATPVDLEDCKRIRLEAIRKYENKLAGRIEKEENRSNEEWLKYFFGEDKFTVLGTEGDKNVGMLRAEKRESKSKRDWFLGSLYVPKGSDPFIVSVMFRSCLFEIIKNRGGKMIRFTTGKKEEDGGVNKLNSVAKILGFEEVSNLSQRIKKTDKVHYKAIFGSNMWELDLSDPKKLEEISKF